MERTGETPMLESFCLGDLSEESEDPSKIEIIVKKILTQMDKMKSRSSTGPDGAHPGVPRELEDEGDKQ